MTETTVIILLFASLYWVHNNAPKHGIKLRYFHYLELLCFWPAGLVVYLFVRNSRNKSKEAGQFSSTSLKIFLFTLATYLSIIVLFFTVSYLPLSENVSFASSLGLLFLGGWLLQIGIFCNIAGCIIGIGEVKNLEVSRKHALAGLLTNGGVSLLFFIFIFTAVFMGFAGVPENYDDVFREINISSKPLESAEQEKPGKNASEEEILQFVRNARQFTKTNLTALSDLYHQHPSLRVKEEIFQLGLNRHTHSLRKNSSPQATFLRSTISEREIEAHWLQASKILYTSVPEARDFVSRELLAALDEDITKNARQKIFHQRIYFNPGRGIAELLKRNESEDIIIAGIQQFQSTLSLSGPYWLNQAALQALERTETNSSAEEVRKAAAGAVDALRKQAIAKCIIYYGNHLDRAKGAALRAKEQRVQGKKAFLPPERWLSESRIEEELQRMVISKFERFPEEVKVRQQMKEMLENSRTEIGEILTWE